MARHLDAGADPKTGPFLSLLTHVHIVRSRINIARDVPPPYPAQSKFPPASQSFNACPGMNSSADDCRL